jgi:oxygen-independent coproporphyrinogen-3 oxidase
MISTETFARYAALRVPRYTSYPTAPHFSPAIDQMEYRNWLHGIPAGEPISIYLHIPFCREMCWYCGCHTTVTRRKAPVSRYVSTLSREIELVTAEMPARMEVGHVHWGGGSPTLLAPEDVETLTSRIGAKFSIAADAEIAVEIDPRTLTSDLAAAFGRAGVNRASLGVQSFDPKVQAAINRVQSFETTAAAARMLRSAGVAALNFDIVYGLPFQTDRSCLQTIWQALQLRPDRLAVFGYAHVPGFKPHQRKIDEAALPGPSERLRQAQIIEEALIAAGYRKVGLDHFALPGDRLSIAAERGALRRNFQGYTTDACATLIGFGASAIGRLPQGFVQNATNIPDYERRIASGQLATVRGYHVSEEDARRAQIIERLMCSYRADVGSVDVPLEKLEADGLIHRSGSTIEVVEAARPLVRTVAAAFDAYLPKSEARHVAAV